LLICKLPYIYAMRLKLLAFILFIAANASAQTKTLRYHDKERGIIEVYTVQKSQPAIKEGPVKIYSELNTSLPLATGYYHKNEKDSLWMYYSGKQLVAEGRYFAGKKAGLWLAFSQEGLRLRYNYTTNQLLYYKPTSTDTTTTFRVIRNGADTVLDRLPICFNGMNTVIFTLMRNIRYPAYARQENKQGGMLLTFTIDENGIAGNYAVKNSPGFDIDTEVLRCIKLSDGDWLPGIIKGKPVAVQCEIPILFVINPAEDASFKGYQVIIAASSVVR
jgi:hypothetical protein